MAIRMQQRRGTSTQWTNANPTLAAGEIGFETNTGKFKIGDGSTGWNSLSYFRDTTAIESTIDSKVNTAINDLVAGAPAALNTLNELAGAIDNNSSFASTIISALATKASQNDVVAHHNATSNVHGIADTSELATIEYADDTANTKSNANILTHNNTTLNVHGIPNTQDLATKTYAENQASTAQSNAETFATNYTDTALGTHLSDTTAVHGIANTQDLATKTYADTVTSNGISTHNADSTDVHGIADTSLLATKSYADSAASSSTSTHNALTTTVHGISNTANLVYTNDSRLSDTRTPTDSTVSTAKIVDGAVTSAKIADGTIVNADINASAAIDWTKLAVSSTVSATELGYVDGVTSAIQTQLDSKLSSASASSTYAPLASPALTGTPTAPTATAGTNTTQIATTAFVKTAVDNVVASAPGALDTLNELAAALGNDANYASTITTALAAKAPLASPTFTGTVTLPAAGIVFSDGTQSKEGVPSRTPIVQKSANYTLSALTERDNLIEVSSASGVTISIPTDATLNFPIGTSIDILQTGAGQVTIAAVTPATTTVNATPGLKLRAQWSSATLLKRAANTWVVMGDLTA